MLRGGDATEQCVIIDGVNFLNNADIDGHALPPEGAPNIMMAAGGMQLKGVIACLRDLPTPAEARASRRREPLRRRQGDPALQIAEN